jgi:flagellar hook protein FlgE
MSSLSSVFSTAISGLDASQTTINVTGNNVANADTVGFKASNALFATQFAETLSAGTAPQGVAGGVGGGTDPIQIGLGVEVATIQTDFSDGSLETTSNPYDLAIQGNGFFSVQEPSPVSSTSASGSAEQAQAQTYYTRNGQFQLNASNQLTTSSGQLLLGYPVNSNFVVQNTGTTAPLSIPLGQQTVAKATTDVAMQGTLPPSGSIATTAQIQTSAVLGDSSWTTPPAGTKAAASDIPTVTAPTTTDDPSVPAGLGVSSSTTYSYEVAFYDPSSGTYGTPSAPISVTTGPSDNEVDFTNLPTDPNYSQLGIFRQTASGSYALVANVDPTTTPTYQDTTPDATLATQTTTLSSSTLTGNYSYYVTYSTANGTESRPSALVGPVNVVNGTIQLTNIPSAPPPNSNNYTQINIYRNTTANPGQYQLLTSIQPGPGQTTYSYTDDIPDATLTAKSSAAPLQQGAALNFNGPPAKPDTLLTDVLVQTPTGTQQLLPGGTLSYSPTVGSNTLTPQTFTIKPTSTMSDLLNFMAQASGITLAPGSDTPPADSSGATAGVTINQQGQIVVTSYNGTNSAISVPLGALTLNNGSGNQEVNLSFSTAQQAAGTGATANLVVYDSLGDAVNVTVTAELQSESAAGTVYRWYADSSGNQGTTAAINVGTGLVTFDGNGNFVNATNDTVTINRDQVAAVNPLTFTLDFSKVSGLASQSASLASSSQDGFAPGTLSSFNIGSDGTITGVFSNGTQRSLGQVALTTFTNPQGLVAQGQNLFVQGPNSGDPITTQPGQGGTGSITAGALEQSNTDVGQSLVDLITASTQYQGNARVISTANTLLQDLLQLGQLG